jgi:hypothetical protein
VLLLFCVFVFAAAAMVLGGVRVWQRTEKTMVSTNDTQTALCYLSNKVRQNDQHGGVYIDDLDGVPALAMESEIDGFVYLTRLYCYNGQLLELFTPAEVDLAPDCGVVLMEAADLSFSQENGMIRATFTAVDGTVDSVLLSARSEEEAAP